jgi:hypothetical protein
MRTFWQGRIDGRTADARARADLKDLRRAVSLALMIDA